MSKLRLNIAMSLDGFVAGPDQGEKDPSGSTATTRATGST
jgi:hypothetical protein